MMNEILKALIDKNLVVVYMDNIMIYTKTIAEHREVMKEVLKRLRDNDLFLKPEKCYFEVSEVEYLGVIINAEGVRMDPKKVAGIRDWPIPKKLKELQGFLGFANFYRRFVKDFSKRAAPLHSLLKKNIEWKWRKEHQQAFENLKEAFTSEPILVYPDPKRPLRVEADSSGYATGSVLSMLCEDGKWRPCAYLSKSLNEVERNYDIHDREMLSIMRSLGEWRHYLEGADHKVEILTDHKNLEYFMNAKKLNQRQARWSLELSRYDFILKSRPGSSSGKPDALSRRPDHDRGEEDNKDITLLKPEFFEIQALQQGHVLIESHETDILKEVRKCKNYEDSVAKSIIELKRSPTKRLRTDEWPEDQDLTLLGGKVYIPNNIELQRKIVKLHHDSTLAGHPGQWKTLELVSRNYWWPGMTKFIVEYGKRCA